MKPSNEAFWWSLFSGGGVMSALFLPVIIVATGFLIPFGADDPAATLATVQKTVGLWYVRISLLGVTGLAFFHCAHRVRHILIDLGLRPLAGPLGVICYAGALLGSIAAGYVLLTFSAG